MKKIKTINEWLNEVSSQKDDVLTTHLNNLDDYNLNDLNGLEFVRTAYEIMKFSLFFLNEKRLSQKVRKIIVFLPLEDSDECMSWSEDLWHKLKNIDEPASIYLLKDSQVFDDDSEEYRRPVSFPYDDNIRAIFRSFRNQDAIDNCWEFTSGIYLIANVCDS